MLAVQVGRAQANNLLRSRVPDDEFSLLVGGDQSLGHAVEHGLQHEALRLQGLLRTHQLLGLAGQVLRLCGQLLFRLLALGDVMQDFGKATQLAALAVDGKNDHVGPEGGAVFANPLSLALEAAFAKSLL